MNMAITTEYVRKLSSALEHGNGDAFFDHVADNVDWTVMGTHPLAGRYTSKAQFLAATFNKLAKVLPDGGQLHLEHLLIKDNVAVVELHSFAIARNDLRFDNRYCWVVEFSGQTIVRVRAYLDSALVPRLFA